MATYIVGDIQGCLSGLKQLLNKVGFNPKKDRLIAVGDLIARGPESLETLGFLYSLKGSFDTVLGNHDLHLLAIYAGIKKAKAFDKLDDLLNSPNLASYIDWLRHKPIALKLDQHTLVTHAGLYPKWSVKKALALSAEVSRELRGDNWQNFVKNMYGNHPDEWQKSLDGYDRLRFIVNAFTRMRFISGEKILDLTCKSEPSCAPSDLTPWFDIKNPKLKSKQRIIFGHWAALDGQTGTQQFIGLDTGYVWGNAMTLLNLSTNEIYSVPFQE